MTTLAITSGGATVVSVPQGTAVTLTATVRNPIVPITVGQVKFCDATAMYCTGNHFLGYAQLTAAGLASLKLIPGPGAHSYKAVFPGTKTYQSSTSIAATLVVVPTPPNLNATSTALQTSNTQGNYTLTATVATQGTQTPTGSVQFLDTTNSNYLLGSNTLAATGQNNIAFVRAGQTPIDANSLTLAGTDFNNDGIPDLVTANQAPNSITVLVGNGDGTFTTSSMINLGASSVIQAVVGDFNSDGKADIAVGNIIGTVVIFLGNGDGTFQQGQTIKTAQAKMGSGFLAAADFNGDGIEDLALTVKPQKPGLSSYVSILLGNGDGTFTAMAGGPSIGAATEILAADLNGDGKADLVTANQYDDTLTLLLGNGDGTFTTPATLPTVSDIYGLAIGDLNNDGIPDMAVAYESGDPLSILLGKGDGTFTTLAPDPALVAYPEALAIADMNGDGIPDIIAPNTDDGLETINVFLGRGDGTFTFDTSSPAQTGSDAIFIVPGDFNGDGREDMAVLFGGSVDVFAGLPSTTAISSISISGYSPVGTGVHELDAVYSGDINYNGSTSPTEPVIAIRVPTTLVLTVNPTTSTFGQSVTLTATLTPYFEQDHSASPTVTFMSGTTAIGTTTLTNGVATFTTTALAAGYDNLSATYPGDTNFVPSASNVVSFLVSGGPSLTTTTTTFTITAAGAPVTTVVSNTLVLFTATVSSGGTNLTAGQVNFCEATAKYCTDVHLLATSPVTKNGTATFKFVPGIGTHSYKAVFMANETYAGSSSAALPLTVTTPNTSPTISTLVATGQPGDYTLTNTVTGAPYLVPTGNISFLDTTNNNYLFGTAPLSVGNDLTFIQSQTLPTPGYVQNVITADFNADGIPDVAVTYPFTTQSLNTMISIFLGNGDGTFTHSIDIAQPIGTFIAYSAILAADFNGDGCPDIAFPANNQYTSLDTVQVLLGNCDGTFKPAIVAVTFGEFEFSLALGQIYAADFNGDGKLDIALASASNGAMGGSVTALLGRGDGTFTVAPTAFTGAGEAFQLVTADYNSDGHLDIATLNVDGTVSLLFGNGDGTFNAAGVSIPIAQDVGGIVTADFNGDGKPDLAVTASSDNTVTILLGNGDGTFTGTASPATGNQPVAISVADFNADGIPDLAVGNYAASPGTATVLLGKGDGTFTALSTMPMVGDRPFCIVTGDFNSDGVPDILVANYGSETLSVLLAASSASATLTGVSVVGTGTHYADASYAGNANSLLSISNLVPLTAERVPTALTLTASPSSSTQGQPVTLTASLNQFFAQNHYAGGNVAFTSNGTSLGMAMVGNNGSATLTTTALKAGTDNLEAVYLGDIDFVGSTAAIVPYPVNTGLSATATTLTVTEAGAGVVTSIPSQTSVTLTATVLAGTTPLSPGKVNFCDATAVHCTDIHLLGTAQLTAAGTATIRLRPGIGQHQYQAIFVGTNTYASSTSNIAPLSVTGTEPTATQLVATGMPGDYTLTANVYAFGGTVPYGTIPFVDTSNSNYPLGNAKLGPAGSTLDNSSTPMLQGTGRGVAIADVNGDGIPDLLSDSGNSIEALFGNGDGTFTRGPNSPTGNAPEYFGIGDFNNDGIIDVAVPNYADNTVTVLLGNGDGTFRTSQTIPNLGVYTYQVVVADFNGDGIQDLAVTDTSDVTLFILLGNGDGTFRALAPFPIETPGSTFGGFMAAADFNGDGKMDLAVSASEYQGQIVILLGNGDGTFTQQLPTGSAEELTYSVAVGDFNADGIPDFAVTTLAANGGTAGNTVTLYLGTGDGQFTASAQADTGELPLQVAAGDLNGDGLADLVTANYSSQNLSAFLTANGATASIKGVSIVGTGTHYAQANYPGTLGTLPSSSNLVPLTAEPLPTMLVLAANPAMVGFRQPVTLTATLSPDNGQNHNATGLVTFTLMGGMSYSAPIMSGIATLNLSALPVGNDCIVAVYAGDTYFMTSTSFPVCFTIEPPPANIQLTASPSTVFLQNPVTLTAMLSAPVGAIGPPMGTVTFEDGNNPLGTTAVNNGVATLSVSTLSLGFHSLTAVYNGSAQVGAATSPVVVELVEDFALTAVNPNVTIHHGGSATYSLTLGAIGGATTAGAISFTLAGTPDSSIVTLSPTTVAAESAMTPVTLTIQTPNYPVGPWATSSVRGMAKQILAAKENRKTTSVALACLSLGAGLLLFGRKRRRLSTRLKCVASLLVLLAGASLSGCGSGWKTQTYTIVVTASSGRLSHTTTLYLTSECADGKTACPIVH